MGFVEKYGLPQKGILPQVEALLYAVVCTQGGLQNFRFGKMYQTTQFSKIVNCHYIKTKILVGGGDFALPFLPVETSLPVLYSKLLLFTRLLCLTSRLNVMIEGIINVKIPIDSRTLL